MVRIKRRTAWSILFTSVFIFSFVCFLLSLKNTFSPTPFSTVKPATAQLKYDEFDPYFMRLNTMTKLEAYCDSLYLSDPINQSYPSVVSDIIRKKFYHGYSYYNMYSNPVATVTSPLIKSGLAAIVISEDIVKYPYAACSQQSIVSMEMLERKGYQVRKVTMFDNVTQMGHFAFEAFYDNGWHYFDPNQEPDNEVLKKYDRPSVAFLNEHPDVIAAAYYKKDQQLFQRLLKSSKLGPVDENPAPIASVYQRTTKFLSNFGWILIGLFILVRYAIFKRMPLFSIIGHRKKQSQFQHVPTHLQGKEVRA